MSVTALAQWYGSARMHAKRIGEQLEGCTFVGIPCAGGLCEFPHITARSILVNDVHRHLINLARVVADPQAKDELKQRLEQTVYHPDVLKESQRYCLDVIPDTNYGLRSITWAYHYFNCVWMTRGASAGTPSEFTGGLSQRWESSGGDSGTRYRSAIEMLDGMCQALFGRAVFSTEDLFVFLSKFPDRWDAKSKHGLYVDPPFFGPGLKYTHGPKRDDAEHWHRKLAERLHTFKNARVVVRAYDIPLLRELYSVSEWNWIEYESRTQANKNEQEVLLVSRQVSQQEMF